MRDSDAEMTRRTMLKVGAAATIGLGVAARGAQAAHFGAASLPIVKAAASDSLVNIMGVRTSLYQANTSLYGRLGLVMAAMRANSSGLGLRHIREAIVLPSTNPTQAQNQRRAWGRLAEHGVDVICGLGDPDNRDGTVPEFASYIKHRLGGDSGYVKVVENSNEPNSPLKSWNRNNRNAWVGLVRTRQKQMAAAFRSDPALHGIKLAGPPLVGGTGLIKYQNLGDLSPYLDRGNFHFYAGNRKQSVPSFELDDILRGVAVYAPGKAVICTETGMHQASASNVNMAYHPAWVAGIYMPRVPLEHFYRGVSRVCEFELLDDHPDSSRRDAPSHFGLLRYNTSSMDPKPAYSSLKRLLDLLRDPGAPFTPGGLAMHVANAPRNYRQLLFQKRNGRRYLCMWRDVSIWDQVHNVAIDVPPVTVRLTLQRPARRINRFRPSYKTRPMASYHDVSTVHVALAGEVQVLEII